MLPAGVPSRTIGRVPAVPGAADRSDRADRVSVTLEDEANSSVGDLLKPVVGALPR
jgi:hypothetical protein